MSHTANCTSITSRSAVAIGKSSGIRNSFTIFSRGKTHTSRPRWITTKRHTKSIGIARGSTGGETIAKIRGSPRELRSVEGQMAYSHSHQQTTKMLWASNLRLAAKHRVIVLLKSPTRYWLRHHTRYNSNHWSYPLLTSQSNISKWSWGLINQRQWQRPLQTARCSSILTGEPWWHATETKLYSSSLQIVIRRSTAV